MLLEIWHENDYSEDILRDIAEKVALVMEEGQQDETFFIEEQVVKESLKLLKLNQKQGAIKEDEIFKESLVILSSFGPNQGEEHESNLAAWHRLRWKVFSDMIKSSSNFYYDFDTNKNIS